MYRCPECGSQRINQWKCLEGPMVCMDCGFRIEDKTAVPNPFYVPDEEPEEPEERLLLGELLARMAMEKRQGKKDNISEET
jgi:transcription initiation factor TFIIIB Brf1 subunit/transcription initiation factor TFIIB